MVRKESVEEYLKGPYTYILVPDEMGGYSAEILEFSGCFAEGETANETMKALDRAAAAWIRAALAQGQEIPPPFSNQGYGGKIALRLPKSLHRQASRFAERNGVSLNQYLVSVIAAGIGAEEFSNRLTTQLLEQLKDHLSVAAPKVTNITLVHYRSDQMAGTSTQQLPPPLNLQFRHIVAKTSGDKAPALVN
jgi:predicted RNase H-like HicB family nuclease